MSFDEKMKKDLKKDLEIPEVVEQKIQNAYKEAGQWKAEEQKSVGSSSCGSDRSIRKWSLCKSGTGEEYPGDWKCVCKNAGK